MIKHKGQVIQVGKVIQYFLEKEENERMKPKIVSDTIIRGIELYIKINTVFL